MRVQNDEIGLNVVVDGDADAPPLLLLHGILNSAATWDWIVPRLSERFRVLRLEFRGHGESDRAPGAYGRLDYVSDAVAACEQAAGAPCVVIGHSLGGATALSMAQARPDLVRAALLEDAPLSQRHRPANDDGDGHALLQTFALLRQVIPQLQAAGTSIDDAAAMMGASPRSGGGTLGELLEPDGLRNMAAAMLQVDATVLDPVLAGEMGEPIDLTVPVEPPVTVVGADPASPDAATDPADVEVLAAASPGVTSHTLAGAGHLIHDSADHREPFWQLVEPFLADLP